MERDLVRRRARRAAAAAAPRTRPLPTSSGDTGSRSPRTRRWARSADGEVARFGELRQELDERHEPRGARSTSKQVIATPPRVGASAPRTPPMPSSVRGRARRRRSAAKRLGAACVERRSSTSTSSTARAGRAPREGPAARDAGAAAEIAPKAAPRHSGAAARSAARARAGSRARLARDALLPVRHGRRAGRTISAAAACRVTAPAPSGAAWPASAVPDAARPGAPLRLAFVGQSTYFEACALDEQSRGGVRTTSSSSAPAPTRARCSRGSSASPRTSCVVFRPEIVPRRRLRRTSARATLGFLTEPIPRAAARAHPDLAPASTTSSDRRGELRPPRLVRPADRADSRRASCRVWRSLPLPVADRLYAPVRRARRPPRDLFVGRSTDAPRAVPAPPRTSRPLHVAFGVGPTSSCTTLLREHDIGINLHNEPYPSFENRVCLHLAAGHSW